jgi:MOSC domain-containing protein YiiM
MSGTIEAIAVSGAAEGLMALMDNATAVAGRGLDGDRYELGLGTYSNDPGDGRELTLIEAEALDSLLAQGGIALSPAEHRRNLTTRGIDLNALVGKRFYAGAVLCEGVRLCEPCDHLVAVCGKDVLAPLVHRGGLRANILAGGVINVGDVIAEAPVAVAEPAREGG